ncbi:MAG: hypothetical protein DMG53_07890 [Acidobacteria bacterium]|nr:MAG: hypothetical protein DMG53_07890 [Acidobacteriota bacterium]
MKHRGILAGAVLQSILVAFAVLSTLAAPQYSPDIPDVDPHKAFGSKNAPVTMEVFSDFQCPACKTLFTTTNRRLMEDYVSSGKVYLIHRDFPLPMHAHSRVAARYARAAAQLGKGESVEQALFQNQEKWEQNGDVDGTVAAVLSAAAMTKVRAKNEGIIFHGGKTAELLAAELNERRTEIRKMMPSSPLNLRRAIIWIGRLVLAGIFIYAGYAKLTMGMRPRPPLGVALSFFALQVDSYRILPSWGVKLVAHTLPFAEIGLGLLLLIGWRFRIWATLVTLIMLGFFAAVVRSYALGMQINCGCFATPEPLTIKTVIRDGALLALALLMTIFAFIEARRPHPWTAPEKA